MTSEIFPREPKAKTIPGKITEEALGETAGQLVDELVDIFSGNDKDKD